MHVTYTAAEFSDIVEELWRPSASPYRRTNITWVHDSFWFIPQPSCAGNSKVCEPFQVLRQRLSKHSLWLSSQQVQQRPLVMRVIWAVTKWQAGKKDKLIYQPLFAMPSLRWSDTDRETKVLDLCCILKKAEGYWTPTCILLSASQGK